MFWADGPLEDWLEESHWGVKPSDDELEVQINALLKLLAQPRIEIEFQREGKRLFLGTGNDHQPDGLRLRLTPGLFLPGQMRYRLTGLKVYYENLAIDLTTRDGQPLALDRQANLPSLGREGDRVVTASEGDTNSDEGTAPVEICPSSLGQEGEASSGADVQRPVEAIERVWEIAPGEGYRWDGSGLTRYWCEAEVEVVFLDKYQRPRPVGLSGKLNGWVGVGWMTKQYQGRGLPWTEHPMERTGVLSWEKQDYAPPSPEELFGR